MHTEPRFQTNTLPDDEAARNAEFESVVSEYENSLLRYTTRLVRNPACAQDVVQIVFIKLFQRWKDKFMPSPELCAWLYRVAHNEAIDHIRRENRLSILVSRHTDEQQAGMRDMEGGTRSGVAEEKAALLIGMLSSREQQVVILKIYEEKSYREISQITGLSESNVGYILHFAMKKMADALKSARSNQESNWDNLNDGKTP